MDKLALSNINESETVPMAKDGVEHFTPTQPKNLLQDS